MKAGPKPCGTRLALALNRVYDGFVAHYGPINKTTITTAEDGSVGAPLIDQRPITDPLEHTFDCATQARQVVGKEKEGRTRSLPPPTYIAPGGLRQDPGEGAQSQAGVDTRGIGGT